MGRRLAYGLDLLNQVDRGAVIYLTRGNQDLLAEFDELANDLGSKPKMKPAINVQGIDIRLHGTGAQIIRALGVKRMRIHTTSPLAFKGLSGFGLEIVEKNIFSY